MASLMLVNPKKRKRRKRKSVKRRVRRRNPIARVNPRKRIKRRRRNPSGRSRGIMGQVKSAVMPAVGAIGLDVIMGYLPLPESFKSGPLRHVVKGAAAIGLGMIAGQFMKKSTAEQIATGALTVTMYNAGRETLNRFAPNIPMGAYVDEYSDNGEMGYYSAGYNPDNEMAALDLESGDGMGAYIDDGDEYMAGMGDIEDELDL